MLEFSRCLYLWNHLSESIHSWTKDTLPHPPSPLLPTLPYSTLPYPSLPLLTLPFPTYPTLFYPTPPTLSYPTLTYPSYPTPTHPTLPYPYPTPPIPSYPPLPYPPTLLPYSTPTLPLPIPYPLRIQTHAHNQASCSRATLSCDSSYSLMCNMKCIYKCISFIIITTKLYRPNRTAFFFSKTELDILFV